MKPMLDAIAQFDPQYVKEQISSMFDVAIEGPPRAYFELPASDWSVSRHHYYVIGFAAESLTLLYERLMQEMRTLHDRIPRGQTTWLYWRRMPIARAVYDDTERLRDLTPEQIEDEEPDWIGLDVRVCVPQVMNLEGIDIRREGMPFTRLLAVPATPRSKS
jgi:hypothetical protein